MTKTTTGVLIVLVLIVSLWAYSAHLKSVGALNERLAQNAAHVRTLDSALKVERAKFSVDTVKVFRRITRIDTLLTEVVKSDTLKLTDTVKVTVEVVREAVATLNACRETVRTCGELRALEQRRADSLQSRVWLMEKQRPSVFGNILRTASVIGLTVAAVKLLR